MEGKKLAVSFFLAILLVVSFAFICQGVGGAQVKRGFLLFFKFHSLVLMGLYIIIVPVINHTIVLMGLL